MTDPNVAAPAAPAAPPAAPTPSAIAWLPADADPLLVGHAQNAGWQSPADAVKSHHELQKLFGADRHGRTVVVPKEDATPEEWSAFHERMGRPKTPTEYGITVPEGGDPKFSEAVTGKFHELGISAKQGKALAEWWNEQHASANAAAEAEEKAAIEAEHATLNADWGTEAPMRRELARRAAEKLGLDEAAINALEKASGFSKTMKALAKVGDLLRESGGEGMGELGSFGMTPEGARSKRAQLMADNNFRAAAMNQASREWAELQKLDKIISGG